MDKRKNNTNNDSWQDPWNADFYETGSTRPPKKHRGVFALVLVGGIILGSVLTALGGINLQLLREWNRREKETELPASLYAGETDQTTVPSVPDVTGETTGDLAVELNPAPQGLENVPQTGGLSFQAIYEKCIPSTVSILCDLPRGTSTGSGVVLSSDGYVITNYHVVEGAAAVSVLFTDGRQLQARMVGGDKLSDLAVLQVDAQDLIPAEFGDSDGLRVGDIVVAIGDPLGVELRGTMTDGIVSAINRDLTTDGRTLTLIQTNAALNSGNSGGPLINCYGQVIGINTLKMGVYTSQSGTEGLGFAIPSTTVQDIVNQLIQNGYVSGRADLGISGEGISEFYQFYYRLPKGLYITDVKAGSSADQVGLEPRDILISIEDTAITSSHILETVLYGLTPGDTVNAVVYRAGRQYKITLTVGEAKG